MCAYCLPSRPKRRQLVLVDFIRACVEEDTLLDEDGESWISSYSTASLICCLTKGLHHEWRTDDVWCSCCPSAWHVACDISLSHCITSRRGCSWTQCIIMTFRCVLSSKIGDDELLALWFIDGQQLSYDELFGCKRTITRGTAAKVSVVKRRGCGK